MKGPDATSETAAASRRRRRPTWVSPTLVAVGVASIGSGLGQFSVTAVVGDVAEAFGAPGAGEDLTSQIGLTATTLGVALAVIRLASLAALPMTSIADRVGRRRTLLACLWVGLLLTLLAALAPGFWVWVAAVALARPWLSAVNALAGVVAAEDVGSRHRTLAIAFVAAAYGLGAGVIPVVRGVVDGVSFRVVTGLALLPLLAIAFVRSRLHEPLVFEASHAAERTARRLPIAVPRADVPRLLALVAVMGGISLATGPGFTYVFVYGENVLGVSSGAMAVLVLAAGPFGLLGLVLGRLLGDRLGRRPAAALTMLATAAGLSIAYRGEPALLFTGYLLALTASAAFGPPAGALLAEAFTTDVRATVTAWAGASGVVGGVVGLAAFGALADASGGFGPAATTLAVVVVVCVVGLLGLPETLGRELDEATDSGA